MLDLSINLGDLLVGLIMSCVGFILIPAVKTLGATIVALRDEVAQLRIIVMGPYKDATTGVLIDIAALQKQTLRHRDWLIRLSAESGSRIEDRT